MRLIALLCTLAAFAVSADDLPRARDGRGRLPRGGLVTASSTVAVAKSIENAIIAGDKVGNWYALQTDGTMLAGSAITLSGVASPGVSPLTFNGTTQYFKDSSDDAFPAGDFSFVSSINFTNVTAAMTLANKWGLANAFIVTTNAGDGTPLFLVFSSTTTLATATGASALTVGSWGCVAGSWTSATSTARIRIAGVTTSGSSSGTGVEAISTKHAFGAQNTAANPVIGSSRGTFFTEKVLSNADMDRICAGVL